MTKQSRTSTQVWMCALMLLLACGCVNEPAAPGKQRTLPQPSADGAATIVDALVKVVEVVGNGARSDEAIARSLGAKLEPTEQSNSSRLNSSFAGTEILIDQGSEFQVRFLFEIYKTDLRLASLAERLGTYEKVYESRTSAVRIDYRRTSEVDVIVFVHLFTPKVDGSSPVLGVSIRPVSRAQ